MRGKSMRLGQVTYTGDLSVPATCQLSRRESQVNDVGPANICTLERCVVARGQTLGRWATNELARIPSLQENLKGREDVPKEIGHKLHFLCFKRVAHGQLHHWTRLKHSASANPQTGQRGRAGCCEPHVHISAPRDLSASVRAQSAFGHGQGRCCCCCL